MELDADVRNALESIALLGGNLSDDRLTSRTGPNDAVARGQMYVAAREIAQGILDAHKPREIIKGPDSLS